MKHNSSEQSPSLAMIAELIAILGVLFLGMAFVFILSVNLLSTDDATVNLGWPLVFGIIVGFLLGFMFLKPKKWIETEAQLRTVELITLAALFLIMLWAVFDAEPQVVLISLSFILGIAFGAIVVVVIRSLMQIQAWSESKKGKEKHASKESIKANLGEGEQNESTS
ncbi:MAG: hypothetical protein ACFFGZ_14815 [Candidatus Thorarchaeota archaeon]